MCGGVCGGDVCQRHRKGRVALWDEIKADVEVEHQSWLAAVDAASSSGLILCFLYTSSLA